MEQVPVRGGEWQALPQDGRGNGARAAWDGAAADGNLAVQLEEMLGADCQPDAEFFVRCWTEGAARAAHDYVDRRRVEKARQSAPVWNWSGSAASFSTAEFVEWQQMHAWHPARQQMDAGAQQAARAQTVETPAAEWESCLDGGEELTVEQARRVLGVGAASTAAEIKGAYRRLARTYHPDRLTDRLEGTSAQAVEKATERMIAINKAYCLLGGGRAAAQC